MLICGHFHAHTCFRTHKKCRERRTDALISLGLCKDLTEHNNSKSSSFCRSSLVPPFLHQEESNTAAETFLHQESPLFLLPTSAVMNTWIEHPSAVSKDVGCSSNFSACDSHHREGQQLPPSDTPSLLCTEGLWEKRKSHSQNFEMGKKECVIH